MVQVIRLTQGRCVSGHVSRQWEQELLLWQRVTGLGVSFVTEWEGEGEGGGGGLPPCVPEGRRVKNTQNHPPLKTLSFFCSQENNGVVLPGVQPYRMSLV